MTRRLFSALLLLTSLAAGAAPRDQPTLLDAHTTYYNEQFASALVLYQRLAAEGDAVAAERAGFMLLEGEAMYGKLVRRNLPLAEALLLQAARSGRPGAAFLLNMMERTE